VAELVTWYHEQGNAADAVSYLLTRSDEHAKMLLLPAYISVQNFIDAHNLLDEYNDPQDDERYNYYLLNDIILGWAETGCSPTCMNQNEEATLYDVKESETSSSVMAANILRFVLDTVFIESNYADTSIYRVEMPGYDGNAFLSGIYPNPVTGTSEIVYRVPDEASFAELNMFEMTGRKVFSEILKNGAGRTIIQSADWSNGCYIIELNLDNSIRERQKLVIQNGNR
jgi:hypothetical protein